MTIGPLNHWYAACASQRLGATPLGVRILDQAIALFRDREGRAAALRDRCIHRGAALSLGEVKEGALACRYHGWRYGADGACSHIPSLVEGQSVPRGMQVTSYPCAESGGYVWVWLGEGAPAAPPLIDRFEAFSWVQGSTLLKCSALAAIENNLDWCHPVFAHPFTHGQFFINQAMGFRDQTIEMRLTDCGLTVFSPPTTDAGEPIPPEPMVSLTYELPDRVTVAFSQGPAGAMRIVVHMVPLAANLCRQEWMVSTGPAGEGGPSMAWSDDLPKIFDQDREVLESCQVAIDADGETFQRSVEADAPTLLARRVWALACEGRWAQGRAALTQRRLVRARA